MDEIISYCGLLCSRCSIFLVSRENDQAKRDELVYEIIVTCKAYYGVEYSYNDITPCDGCITLNGKLFSGCKNCEIRKCASSKKIKNCAYCSEYSCNKLTDFFHTAHEAKTRLDQIRYNLI